ncbi:hypothetical protein EWM64_g8943, partial [Hericium alpestre]
MADNASSTMPGGTTKDADIIQSGKRVIVTSAKMAHNIEVGAKNRGADRIFASRSFATEAPPKKRKPTVEDVPEGDLEYEDGAGSGQEDKSSSDDGSDTSVTAPKLNRAQMRQIQRDLKKAAKGKAASGRGHGQKGATGAAKAAKPAAIADPDVLDANGLLEDLSHIDVDLTVLSDSEKVTKLLASADVKHFFSNTHERKDENGKTRKVHDCTICRDNKKAKFEYVVDLSTSHRHLQSEHKVGYRAWAKAKKFTSMLPEDTEKRRQTA